MCLLSDEFQDHVSLVISKMGLHNYSMLYSPISQHYTARAC